MQYKFLVNIATVTALKLSYIVPSAPATVCCSTADKHSLRSAAPQTLGIASPLGYLSACEQPACTCSLCCPRLFNLSDQRARLILFLFTTRTLSDLVGTVAQRTYFHVLPTCHITDGDVVWQLRRRHPRSQHH